MGLLLNLLQIRMEIAGGPKKLDDIVAEGTPTTKFWLDKWMADWTTGAEVAADAENEKAIEIVKNFHTELYNEQKRMVLQCAIEVNGKTFPGPRTKRWPTWLKTLSASGKIGKILFQKTTATSRKRTTQSGFLMLPLDIFQYEVLFGNKEAFGEMNLYMYDPSVEFPSAGAMFNVDFDWPVLAVSPQRRQVVLTAREVVNLNALEERQNQGHEVTGERRPEHLRTHVQLVRGQGYPVEVAGIDVQRCENSNFWERVCEYVQIDGIGRAYQILAGIQPCTRECRPVGFEGLCVGELDLILAFYQLLVKKVRPKVSDAEFNRMFGIFVKLLENTDVWKNQIGNYYAITGKEVKTILSRLLFDGNIRPDSEWDPCKEGERSTIK